MQVCSRNSTKGLALQLRPMVAADVDAVLAIEICVHSHPWRRNSFINSLTVSNDCWVVEIQQRLVGYVVASIGGGEAELLNISVASDVQGQGVGRVLLDFIVSQVSFKAEMLFLEVRPSNSRAIALYHAHGFNEVGRRPNYYPAKNGREDALIFACVLD